MSEIRIRPYEARDRAAVRRICCDTADRGEPVENFFSDRNFVADLVTKYYTDFEPQHSWVAERDGEVVGYLTGCLDTRTHVRVTAWRIAPLALAKSMLRGTLFRRQTWRMLCASIRTAFKRARSNRVSLDDFPAHFHVNLARHVRGQGVGRRLAEKFLEQAVAAGVCGIRAVTRADNETTCKFNEKLGFTLLDVEPLVMPKGDEYEVVNVAIYGKRLSATDAGHS